MGDNHLSTKKDYKTPRPTKWSPPSYEKEREWMKNWEKPTADIDEPTYEKEPAYLSWGQNPYNNRERRSQMMAQLEEQIESGKQELAALDALEIDVSEEQDEEGMKQAASTNGNAGFFQSDWSACFRTTSAQSNVCHHVVSHAPPLRSIQLEDGVCQRRKIGQACITALVFAEEVRLDHAEHAKLISF